MKTQKAYGALSTCSMYLLKLILFNIIQWRQHLVTLCVDSPSCQSVVRTGTPTLMNVT